MFDDRCKRGFRGQEVNLERAPFYGAYAVADIRYDMLAIRCFLFAQQESCLINAVDCTVRRNTEFLRDGAGGIMGCRVREFLPPAALLLERAVPA